MVNKIKKLFWKLQDFYTSLSMRCELDLLFNVIHTILLLAILFFVIYLSIKFREIDKFLFYLVRKL